jgi:hypothetical protein
VGAFAAGSQGKSRALQIGHELADFSRHCVSCWQYPAKRRIVNAAELLRPNRPAFALAAVSRPRRCGVGSAASLNSGRAAFHRVPNPNQQNMNHPRNRNIRDGVEAIPAIVAAEVRRRKPTHAGESASSRRRLPFTDAVECVLAGFL